MSDNVVDVLLRARLDAGDVTSGVGDIQKALSGLTLPKGISTDLEKSFGKLTPLLKDYQKQLNKGFSSQKDIKNFNLLKEKIDSTFGEIKSKIQEVNGQEVRLKVDTQQIDNLQNKIVKLQSDLQTALQKVFKGGQSEGSIKTGIKQLEGAIPKNWTNVTSMLSGAKGLFKTGDYAAFNRQLSETLSYINQLKSSSQIDLAHKLGMKEAKTDLKSAQTYLNNFFKSLQTNINEANNIERLRKSLADVGQELDDLKFDAAQRGIEGFSDANSGIETLINGFHQLHSSTEESASSMVRMVDEVNQLKTSTQYFFSLRNMINLLKRGVDEAVQSVKDLDKAMTDTAVVTDYKVSDLWDMLPKYVQLANQLGATTQGAYETMTLYFQQGLDQQQAFEVGAETMKMARIAGLDYAETTDMMTAALRGFNMELNETSAKRVNDVYSELAAITASDTEELGTAMQRTASIAHSAGASFEGATAFLAQAIETTREPAENIGTAMKTIIARFQEMKKNPLEISEVDGEEVDFNKIDAALKTIGVDLVDANGQFREWDKVMLDISAKWDTLSQSQQRYIATVAAGSRQQSRFIAMVSNYDRTMQLMEAANNSAGASDEQFGKTMDSLESKLNKLHNAWELFTMGIANNGMIKFVVDGMTTFLTITNKVIDTLSMGKGAIKSFLSVFAAFTGLKVAGRAANSLIGGLGGLVDPQSSFKEGLRGGFLGGRSQLQADKISNPIVQAIYDLIPVIKGVELDNQGTKGRGPGDYNAARKDLKTSDFLKKGNGISLKNISNFFDSHQLNDEQQAAFLKASPGLRSMLSKQLGKIYEQAGASPETKRGMVAGFKKGTVTLKKALAHEDLYESFSDMMARAEKNGSESQMAKAAAIRDKYSKQFQKEAAEKGVDVYDYLQESFANLKVPKEGVEELMAALNERSPMEKFQDGLGKVGASLMSAGSTLQMFGSTLSKTNPILGQFVTSLGGALTTIGSLANTIPALMNPVTLALTAVGAAITYESIKLGKITTAAEEITTKFEESNKTTQDNIASLKAYKNELATLAKGVDINGNNVSLSDSEYGRYLEIVDHIAQINPEIVRGYNAQGHAIIDNNNALTETLKLLEQTQKTTLEDYISDESLQKLIDARNINSDYSRLAIREISSTGQANGTATGGFTFNGKSYGGSAMPSIKHLKNPLAGSVFEVVKELEKEDWFNQDFLDKYNIKLEELKDGEANALRQFVNNREAIYNEAAHNFTEQGQEVSEALTSSFENLNSDKEALDTAVAPVLQNLQTYISNNPAFKNIGVDFQSALMSGLKDIVIQPDLDASEMQQQARVLVQEFDNLTAEGSRYSIAMKEVEKAQNQFASSLNKLEYAENTEHALRTLNSLLKENAGNTTAYGQAITEYLTNQIAKIENFTEEGAISLIDALNSHTSDISGAEGAFSAFQESTKNDFSTAADNMKSIFDEITKETEGVQLHMQGQGDNTLWTGMSALFSEEAVEKAAKKGPEAIQSMLNRIKPMLQEGQAGFDAFWTDMFSDENYAKLKDIQGVVMDQENWEIKWDDDINPNVFKEMADALGYSEQYLTSMLNKGRQFADLNFMDMSDVRKALSTDTATVKGTSTSRITNDEGKKETVTDIFVKKDYLTNALREAGYVNPQEQQEAIKNITQNGIKIIPDAKSINVDTFKKMGISDLSSLIKTLGDTGQFNRSEIEEYAQNMEGYNAGEFDTLYKDYLDSQEHPELPSINSIDNNVASIAHMIAQQHGIADQETKDAYAQDSEVVYGANGTRKGDPDSMGEFFALGLNKNGKKLSSDEYKTTQKHLEQLRDGEKAQIEYYEAQAKKAKEELRTEDAKWFEDAAKGAESKYKLLEKQLKEGEEAYKEAQEAKQVNNYPSHHSKEKPDYRPTSEIEREKAAEAAKEEKKVNKARKKFNKEQQQKYDSSYGKDGTWIPLEQQQKQYNKQQKKQQRLKQQQLWQQSKRNWETDAQNTGTATGKPIDRSSKIRKGLQFNRAEAEILKQGIPALARAVLTNPNYLKKVEQEKQNDFSTRRNQYEHDAQNNTDTTNWWNKPLISGSEKLPFKGPGGLNWSSGQKNIQYLLASKLEAYLSEEGADSGISAFALKFIQNWKEQTLEELEQGTQEGVTDNQDSIIDSGVSFDGFTTDSEKLGTALEDSYNILEQTESSLPTQNIALTSKIIDSTEQLGQTLKDGWNSLKNTDAPANNVGPVTKTINKGLDAVTNIANQTIENNKATFEVDTGDSEPKLQAVAAAGDEAYTATNKTSKFTISTPGVGKLATAAKAADNLNKKGNSTTTFKVSAGKLETSGIEQKKKTLAERVNIPVGLQDTGISSQAANFRSKINTTTVSIPVRLSLTGSTTVTFKPAAKGMNNKIVASHVPQAGSLAKGTKSRYGQVGPKNKGGLTLTGEKGFEIAWLPKENRSMILGAKGPQMLNLPSDAVVWTHEQSKKILKQKAIPAGSHSGEGKYTPPDSSTPKKDTTPTTPKKTTTVVYKPATLKSKDSKKTDTIIQKAGKVVVWWDNYSRKLETLTRSAEKQLKKSDNLLKQVGMTITKFNKNSNVKGYKESLQRTITLNKTAEKRAKGELNSLRTGKKYKGKRYSRQEISYEITERNKKGEKVKKTKNKTIDISKYIKKVGDDYIIDQKAINKVANKNKSKAESIVNVINKELDEKISNRNKAQDEIAKAKEAFEELANKVYEAFGGWEKSITHVYVLSKRLEELSTRKNLYDTQAEHEYTRLRAGFGTVNSSSVKRITSLLQKAADTMVKQVKTNAANVSATSKEYTDSLSRQFYYSSYMNLKKQGGNGTDTKNDWKTAKMGLNFLDSIGFNEKNFNYNTAVTKLLEKGYTNDTYDKIKEFLDRIYEKQINYEQAIIDAYGSMDEIYNTIIEYRDFISDFEGEVLAGLEEQTEKEIEHLDKLNSSLTAAYKDLLDEVKNSLDARRKKEDNEKTESDLSKRMQRLALLRADTSGGHAVEIAQLEQEIADAQKDYQRSLEDQLIENLQNQADKAEKQRERQIELLQVQADLAKGTGENLALVTQWLTNPTANEGKIKKAWLDNQGYNEMTPDNQKKLLDDWNATWAQFLATRNALPILEKAAKGLETKSLGKNDTLEGYQGNVLSYLNTMSNNIDRLVNYNKTTKAAEYKKAGASVREAIKESKARGDKLSYPELKAGGYTAADFKKDNIPVKRLKKIFGLKQLAKGGYTYAELRSIGYRDKDFKSKINAATARAIGMPPKTIAKLYGGSKALRKGNVGGAVVQKTNKFSATKIQKTINKNKKDAATQSDMAGVTTKMDINGKKKGGSKTGTISTSGKKIATNKGSRLYIQDWDKKKARAAGKSTQKVYKAKELTAAIFKANKDQATDALIYAIKHTEPGKVINANSATLFKLAGLQGKTYKLQNEITGTVGKNGIIYYNDGKKGVNKWNTAKGGIELDKYTKKDKKRFQKLAKTNKTIGREYAQVLKKRGIKYATGGLADYTGPAWLDGTPSKPELVLNAQDTKNFIALKDVLNKAIGSTGAVENTYGNATYEININVDHLNNDYDVDKVVERVKKKIVQDSSYRNVTQVRKFR